VGRREQGLHPQGRAERGLGFGHVAEFLVNSAKMDVRRGQVGLES
jgi:hypothetical protein